MHEAVGRVDVCVTCHFPASHVAPVSWHNFPCGSSTLLWREGSSLFSGHLSRLDTLENNLTTITFLIHIDWVFMLYLTL
jgi:hypothetical protein